MQMSVDGFAWMRCGIGARADRKTRQAQLKLDLEHMVLGLGLWPGKFPQTSCLAKVGVKVQKWLLMHANGLA